MPTQDLHSFLNEYQQTEQTETVRFTDAQRREAMKRTIDMDIVRANTDKIPVQKETWLDEGDVFARVNALIRYGGADLRVYITLQKKLFIQISSIIPSADGKFWDCSIYNAEVQGMLIRIPSGSPVLLYIKNTPL